MYPNLKLQLWKTGMRQNRLAKSLGMDETMLSKIVNGDETRNKIAVLLGSDATWLFERCADHPGPNDSIKGNQPVPNQGK